MQERNEQRKNMRVRRNNERPQPINRNRERRGSQGSFWIRRVERIKKELTNSLTLLKELTIVFKDEELDNSLDNVVKRLNELINTEDSDVQQS